MPDTTTTISVNIENLEKIKELRKELEKIRDLKKEINEEENDDPIPPHPPRRPKKRDWPRIFTKQDGETNEFEADYETSDADDKVIADTQFHV